MVDSFIHYVSIVIIILLLVTLAQKLKIAYPIVLVLGGLLLSLIPGLPIISITPEMIFIIFLPPLLFEAAWYTSSKDFWRWRRVITSFASILVIITSLVIAVVSSTIIPGFTLAMGFLLGAIVSPPDAVSATAILKDVKVPKRVSTILEGESLLNDASSLIIFRFALVAVDTGRFVFHEAATSFVVVIVMGVVVGLIIGLLYYFVHKWLPTDTNVDVVLTLTAPYVMYIVAEKFHFSGVLSVVSGGLFLSARSHLFLSHRSRIRGTNVWSSFGFVLNGLVFMLIGLELTVIVNQLNTISLQAAFGYGVLITVTLIITRMVCALGASAFTMFISRFINTADSRPGWRGPVIIAWGGMRGVVSLAAALSIPLYLTHGEEFPQRNLILFITFTVILITLIVQGLTLPYIIRLVNMEDPDNPLPIREYELQVRKKLAEQGLQFLEENHTETLKTNKALRRLRTKFKNDQLERDASITNEHEDYRQIYQELLLQQRALLYELNKQPDTDNNTIRKYQTFLDIEEEKLRMRFEEEEEE